MLSNRVGCSTLPFSGAAMTNLLAGGGCGWRGSLLFGMAGLRQSAAIAPASWSSVSSCLTVCAKFIDTSIWTLVADLRDAGSHLRVREIYTPKVRFSGEP
jgi:hypothetical protein